MKIIRIVKSHPTTQKLLAHDAPVLRIMNLALWAFIIISSITVFFGVQAHISEYLDPLPWLVVFPAYAVAYILFSLVPDVLNSIFAAHVVRSFLIRRHKDLLSGILILTLLIIVCFLSRYSWKMSRSSATSLSNSFAPVVALDDVAKFDSLATMERIAARTEYENDLAELEQRFATMLQAQLLPLENRALPFRTKIAELEANRSKNNTSWTSSQIDKTRKKLLPIEDKIAKVQVDIQTKKTAEIQRLKKLHKDNTQFLNNRLYENRKTTSERNNRRESRVEVVTATFANEFRKIAGFAIVIVLILTSLIEILYHRNGIERQPLIQEWSFQLSGLFEVLYLPFSFIGRHTLNRVRKQYAKLPALEPEPIFKQTLTTSKQTYQPNVTARDNNLQAVTVPVNTALQPDNACNNYDSLFGESQVAVNTDCEENVALVTIDNNGVKQQGTGSDLKVKPNGNTVDHALRGTSPLLNFLPLLTDLAKQVRFISDELFATCTLPTCENKFRKKRSDHKYCCQEHRQEDWELRNGKKLKIKS